MRDKNRFKIILQQDGEITDFVQKCYFLLLCYLFGGELIKKALLSSLRLVISVPYKLDTALLYGFVIILVGIVLKPILKRFPGRELLPFFFLLIVFLISWIIQSGYDDMLKSMLWDYLLGVGGYICFRCVTEWDRLLRWFSGMAFLITFSLFVYLMISGGIERYSQYLGYGALVGAVISANEMIRRRSILHGVNMAFGFVLLLAMGARGPVACLLIFLAVRLILEVGRSRYGVLFFILIVAAAWLIFNYLEVIMQYLLLAFEQMHLSTRALQKLQNAEFFNHDSRDLVLDNVIHIFWEHPIVGVGIGRDRILVAEMFNDTANAIGYYAHKIYAEIWIQFGLILGTLLLALIVIIVLRALTTKGISREARDVVLILLANGVIPLMISDSYFTRPSFFYAMAVCVAVASGHVVHRRGRNKPVMKNTCEKSTLM